MKKYCLLFLLLIPAVVNAQGKKRKEFTTTPTYPEIISAYETFAKQNDCTKLLTYGTTDVGKPLHLFVISKSKEFTAESLRKQNKRILLINNGIHPGEPDGIDASIELVKTLVADKSKLPEDVVVCIIPVYNVGGCLNRGKYSRANQNGPIEYGFRGNAQNLDLNRDFIKADSKNAKTFSEIFQTWKPNVFVDTHTSNGADYQYIMTLIATQKDKLNPVLSKYMSDEMLPQLYGKMKANKFEMCPYVDSKEETPDQGIVGFMETPRFATGYSTMFNTIGFTSETHMWKSYNDRVWATYEFLLAIIETTQKDALKIGKLKSEADAMVSKQKEFVLNWELDTTKADTVSFNGYEATRKISSISGKERLFYDRAKPFTKKIPFYNYYKPKTYVTAPAMYVIPQAWTDVLERMKLNGVEMKRLSKDTSFVCETYYITSYETVKNPYEGHYLHFNVKTKKENQHLNFSKGDYVVEVNQASNRYIVEVLEPEGSDSFFAWNFFDAILQQKEWFSDYVFEEKAEELLKENPDMKAKLEEKKKSDTAFASSHWAQLNFIYRNSPYYEKSHNRYPVVRLKPAMGLPLEK